MAMHTCSYALGDFKVDLKIITVQMSFDNTISTTKIYIEFSILVIRKLGKCTNKEVVQLV